MVAKRNPFLWYLTLSAEHELFGIGTRLRVSRPTQLDFQTWLPNLPTTNSKKHGEIGNYHLFEAIIEGFIIWVKPSHSWTTLTGGWSAELNGHRDSSYEPNSIIPEQHLSGDEVLSSMVTGIHHMSQTQSFLNNIYRGMKCWAQFSQGFHHMSPTHSILNNTYQEMNRWGSKLSMDSSCVRQPPPTPDDIHRGMKIYCLEGPKVSSGAPKFKFICISHLGGCF